jgi:hypothetical protein
MYIVLVAQGSGSNGSSPSSSSGEGPQADGDDAIDLPELLSAVQRLGEVQGVLSGLGQRMALPPVTLLFNASSYHAAMALYTDLQQARGKHCSYHCLFVPWS